MRKTSWAPLHSQAAFLLFSSCAAFARRSPMAEAEKELERDLVDVGNKLLSLPSDVEELLSLLNLAEDFLSRVEQVPSVSMRTALYPVMKALAAKYLLNHSEDVVKVALASCFSEIAIITSPVDPYNEDLMKDIFRIIVDSLKNLDDLSSPIFYKKVSILENIAKVHSCVLMLNLECDDLILEMFQHFLKTIRPANTQRVFSIMETIMTTLLNESEIKILSYFVNTVVKDIKDALPIARSLVEKVTGNCAGKLKPYLIKLFQSNGASSNEYGDIIASLCQEKSDTVELNEPSTDDERLVDDSILSAGPTSYELPQEYRKLETKVDCPKDIGTLVDNSSIVVQTNGSLKQKLASHCVIAHPEIATIGAVAELDDLNSSTVVKSDGIIDYKTEKRRDQNGNSLVQLRYTTSNFQSDGDKALSMASRRMGYSEEVDHPSGRGASDNYQSEGESLPSEGSHNNTIKENHASAAKQPRKSYKCAPYQIFEDETNLVNLSQEDADNTIKTNDSEAETVCRTGTRRSTRKVVEGKLCKQQNSEVKQHVRKAILENDVAGETISKSYGEREFVDAPLKNTDETIGSEENNLRQISTRRSARKAAEMKSSKYHKSKIEQLTEKVTVEDDLSGKKSVKVSEAENRDKEMNEALVGAEIKVWWPDDEMFYEGAVDSFDPVSKKHTILYFDGDVEILLLKDECWEFLEGGRKSDVMKRRGKENPRPGSSQEMTPNKKGKKISHPVVKQETKKRPPKLDKTVNQSRASGPQSGGQKSGRKSVTRTRSRPRAGAPRLASQRIDKMFEEFKRKAKARRNDTAVTVECSMDNRSETKGMDTPHKESKSNEGIPQADWSSFRKAGSKYDSDGACEKRKRMMLVTGELQSTEDSPRRRPRRAYSS